MNVQALREGLHVVEVPSFETPRVNGSSRLRTIPDGWRVLMTIFNEAADHYLGFLRKEPNGTARDERYRNNLRVH
jgi:hypothetical protein